MFACLVTYFLQFAWPNLIGYYLPNKQKTKNKNIGNGSIKLFLTLHGLDFAQDVFLIFYLVPYPYTPLHEMGQNPPNQKLKNSTQRANRAKESQLGLIFSPLTRLHGMGQTLSVKTQDLSHHYSQARQPKIHLMGAQREKKKPTQGKGRLDHINIINYCFDFEIIY